MSWRCSYYAKTYAELEAIVRKAVGSLDLMAFTRFDLGKILSEEQGKTPTRSLRLVAGNPLIMNQMVMYVADAGSYARSRSLIDQRPDGVHLSDHRMASLIAPYGSAEARTVRNWTQKSKLS